jgi:hypothetical protein
MADPTSIAIAALIAGSVGALAWYTSHRHWNVDREDDELRDDDELREGEATRLISNDEEEG